MADLPKVARRSVGNEICSPVRASCRSRLRLALGERVDLRSEREVGLGQAAVRVGGERQAHVVPAVHEDVGVVIGRLCGRRDGVDERDRCGEVGKLALAHDLGAVALPLGVVQVLLDLCVAEQCHRRAASIASPHARTSDQS
jgi:hypothetical protein